ncbi:hypothetical protein LC593_04685 [Nostoc sp. CHAB 5844]|nr:hypothetical protein [Nostoc sp. CHAB 5844]
MNIYANGNGRGKSALKFETYPYSRSGLKHFWEDSETQSRNEQHNFLKTLRGIDKAVTQLIPFAQYLAPIAAQVLLGTTPTARVNFNLLTAQLLLPLLAKGDRISRQKEAEFFGAYEVEVEVANTEIAQDAALIEVLAAEASHSENENEATALISTALPITFRVMDGQQLLRPVLPTLLVATARLVRFLHRHSRSSRRLLRLVPSIFHRTVASLLVAQRWGCPMTSALVGCIIAAQTKRVLTDANLVSTAMTRNILIRRATVAAVPSFSGVRRSSQNEDFFELPSENKCFTQFTRRICIMPLFEAPAAHETHYNNPYSNPEFEDEWEANPESHYNNPYSNPEQEWEATNYSNPYSNPEFEDEWEANPESHYSNPYSNPEQEWEATNYSNPYSNPEFEEEGEYFFKKAFRTLGRGIGAAARAAAPLAKKFAPIVAGKLASMIPGVGVIAGPLAAKLTSQLVQEAETEAEQMEAEFFGTNEAEAEVANNETAHEAALTEFLAAQAAEATTEAEAEAAIAATLPITITIAGGRRALRPVMPVLAQATGRLTRLLRQQGPAGQQLLRTIPTIQRQTAATLKAVARSGQPINSATAVKAMANATNRVLSNSQRVQRAIIRNAVLRQRTAPPNPHRTAAHSCPTCARPIR